MIDRAIKNNCKYLGRLISVQEDNINTKISAEKLEIYILV